MAKKMKKTDKKTHLGPNNLHKTIQYIGVRVLYWNNGGYLFHLQSYHILSDYYCPLSGTQYGLTRTMLYW